MPVERTPQKYPDAANSADTVGSVHEWRERPAYFLDLRMGEGRVLSSLSIFFSRSTVPMATYPFLNNKHLICESRAVAPTPKRAHHDLIGFVLPLGQLVQRNDRLLGKSLQRVSRTSWRDSPALGSAGPESPPRTGMSSVWDMLIPLVAKARTAFQEIRS